MTIEHRAFRSKGLAFIGRLIHHAHDVERSALHCGNDDCILTADGYNDWFGLQARPIRWLQILQRVQRLSFPRQSYPNDSSLRASHPNRLRRPK